MSAAQEHRRAGISTLATLGVYTGPAREFAEMAGNVSPTVAVYGRLADGVLDLWALTDERDEMIERGLAQSACELMRRHPNLAFDFMIIEKCSPSASTIADSGYIPIL